MAIKTALNSRLTWVEIVIRNSSKVWPLDDNLLSKKAILAVSIFEPFSIGAYVALCCFQSCEKIRARLENCNIDNEIKEFIDNNFTGSTRPGRSNYCMLCDSLVIIYM